MITKDSWNDRRKQSPTNRKLLAVFDAGDNRRITLVVIVHPDNTLEFPDVACGCNFVVKDMLYWQEIEIPNDRETSIKQMKTELSGMLRKFTATHGPLTDAEKASIKSISELSLHQ